MIATTLSFRLMEMACQSSYPLNSDIASPPGTFALYLSCAAMAKPATRASTTARITAIWTFIRSRLLLLLAALLPSCCGTGVWVIVFSSFNQLMKCCHKRTRSKGRARGYCTSRRSLCFGVRNGLIVIGLYVLSSARREKTCYADGIDQSW